MKDSTKGPNSLGGKNDRNIAIKFRGFHPSYIGKIDISVCGNSDPGTTGSLTPMAKTNGLYFTEVHEPESFGYEFSKRIESYDETDMDVYIDVSKLGEEEYYDTMEKLDDIASKCTMIIQDIQEVQKTL